MEKKRDLKMKDNEGCEGGSVERVAFKPTETLRNSEIYRAARSLCSALQEQGHQAYFVGGAVRDFFLDPSKELKDIDVTTSAPPEVVHQIFPGSDYVGKAFGVCLVKVKSGEKGRAPYCFEVATFRKEGCYTDRRHPDVVALGSLEEDSVRRDFTMNALYFDPVAEVILDLHGGLNDIASRCIRAVGVPRDRFYEDALRIVRLFRFAANCEMNIDSQTLSGAVETAEGLALLSGERVVLECQKVYAGRFIEFISPMFAAISPQYFDKKFPVSGVGLRPDYWWPEYIHIDFPLSSLAVVMAGEAELAASRFVQCAAALYNWPGTRIDARVINNILDVLSFLKVEQTLSYQAKLLNVYRLWEKFKGVLAADAWFFADAAVRIFGENSSLMKAFLRRAEQRIIGNEEASGWSKNILNGRVTSEMRADIATKVREFGGEPQLVGVWAGLIEARIVFEELGMKTPAECGWESEPQGFAYFQMAQRVAAEIRKL
jgi:hypothetical protein